MAAKFPFDATAMQFPGCCISSGSHEPEFLLALRVDHLFNSHIGYLLFHLTHGEIATYIFRSATMQSHYTLVLTTFRPVCIDLDDEH